MKFKKAFSIIILLLTAFGLLSVVLSAQAEYKITVTIPHGAEAGSSPTLIEYIKGLYLFALGLVGVAALISLVIGGFIYMLSDSITSKEMAKQYIWGALSGLILALAAYLILYIINPDLVNWSLSLQ